MNECRRFLISGRVQGVCFRAATRQQAERLRLAGYAHNLPDGRVEVVASGERQAIEALAAWLARGPAQAEVTGVVSDKLPMQTFSGFSIG